METATSSESIDTLLSTVSSSLVAARKAAPTDDTVSAVPAGLRLLDVKTEIFLSYLQNVAFLLFLRLDEFTRHSDAVAEGQPAPGPSALSGKVLEKIAELRLYFDKGITPLENKLKHEITRVLAVADRVERIEAEAAARPAPTTTKNKTSGSGSQSGSGSDSGSESEEEASYGPALSAIKTTAAYGGSRSTERPGDSRPGVYRPPRFAATTITDNLPKFGKDQADQAGRDGRKSRTLDEFVSTELSSAPSTLPSVGSNIAAMGRRMKSDRDRQTEGERQTYEETNFVRLPTKVSKKDKMVNKRVRASQYGGEDWRDLNVGVDRISKLTTRQAGRSKVADALDRSRKRRADDDNDRAGYRDGDAFQLKRKKFMRNRGATG